MYKIYQVEYGDTIDKIAMKAGTTIDNIKNINGFNGDNDLVVGSLIVVPREEKQIFQTYTIKKGDSIYSISKMFDVDLDTILLLNGLNKSDYIYPNQQITIPNNDVAIYVTKKGDTIDFIINNLGIDANKLNEENNKIFVVEDQLIAHKKEGNR